MRTNTIDFTGVPLLLRTANGGVTVSIPIRIRRYGGRKQVVVPQGVLADLNAVAAPTALQVALARGHRWQVPLNDPEVARGSRRRRLDAQYSLSIPDRPTNARKNSLSHFFLNPFNPLRVSSPAEPGWRPRRCWLLASDSDQAKI